MSNTSTTEPTQHDNLYAALAAFQARVPSVRKGNTAKVESARGAYSYDYADLADVTDAVLPALAAVGLAWITRPDTSEDGTINLHYALVHGASGDAIEGHVAVGRKGDRWQDLGSALTYARRYMLVSVTGVAPGGDDNDGQDARAGSAPAAAPVKSYLPAGLYDLSTIDSKKKAEQTFYVARGAGHLNLYVETPSGQEVMFGDWLRATAASLPDVAPEDVPAEEAKADAPTSQDDDPDAAAVAAHESTLVSDAAASGVSADDARAAVDSLPTAHSEAGN